MASIHPLAGPGRLAAVPEGGTDGSAAPPPRGLYRDWIRTVPVSGAQRRPTMRPTILGHSGSSYSTASSSCPSNNSGHSSGSASAVALECLANQEELTRIVRRCVEAFVRAFRVPAFGGSPDHALKNWFWELDVDWVLQIDDEHGLRRLLRDKPATTQDLVDKWIRALAVIVASITELVCAFPHRATAVAPFGKASITEMLVVVDVIITVLEAEKLRAVLDMFTCVCGASHMFTPVVISSKFPSVLNELGGSLEREGNRLSEIIASTMKEMKTHVEEDDSWAMEIRRGGGEVHKNTRFIMDCIVSIMNTHASMKNSNSAPSDNTENLTGLIDVTIDYLKDLLLRKSGCSQIQASGCFIPELRHLTLIPPECKMYMDSYLDVSWGHVLSCIPKSRFPGPIHCWINTPSLAKFESAFHKTYQAQQFWKVPDPRLSDVLRRAITGRVISGYSDYLEEHPELEKHIGRESSSPAVLEEMLGQLFEG